VGLVKKLCLWMNLCDLVPLGKFHLAPMKPSVLFHKKANGTVVRAWHIGPHKGLATQGKEVLGHHEVVQPPALLIVTVVGKTSVNQTPKAMLILWRDSTDVLGAAVEAC